MATSYFGFGAMNGHPTSQDTFLEVESLDPDRDRERIKKVLEEPAVAAVQPQIKKAAKIELIRGSERDFIAPSEPIRLVTPHLEEILTRVKQLPTELRAELEKRSEQAKRLEAQTRFRFTGAAPAIRNLGRITKDQCAFLVDESEKWRAAEQPFNLKLVTGEVRQVILRVEHEADCLLTIKHKVRGPQSKAEEMGGFNVLLRAQHA